MWSSPVPLGQKQPQGMFPTPWGWCSRGHSQQDFNPLHCSVLPEVFFGDWGPSCLQIIKKLLPCSFGLIQYLSNDHPHTMRQHIAQSSRLRAIDDNLMFRSFPLIEIKKEQKKGRKKERNLREAEFWLGCRESACMHCGSWPIQRDSLFSRASLCSREATGCHDSQKPRSHKWLHTSLCLALHCIWSWMVRMEAAIVNSPQKCPWCTHPTATVKLAPQLFCLSTADCACFSRTKLYMLYHMHMSLVNESFKKQSLSSSSSFLL